MDVTGANKEDVHACHYRIRRFLPLRYSGTMSGMERHADPERGSLSIGNDVQNDLVNGRYRRHRIKRRIRDGLLVVVAAVLMSIIAMGAYYAISGIIVAVHIRSAVTSVTKLQGTDVMSGRAVPELKTASDELRKNVDAAYWHTGNPVWALAGQLPKYGGDVEAVRSAVDVLHQMADDALPLMVDAADDVDVSRVSVADGVVSIPGIQDAASKLARANEVVAAANVQLQSIRGVSLGALERQLVPAQKKFMEFAKTSDALSRGAQLLPAMLGMNDPTVARNYLVLAQNNAELRATGGITGAIGLVTVQNGRLTLHDFLPAVDFQPSDEPVIALNPDEAALFGDRLGRFVQDVNFTPDFARTGQLAKAIWEAKEGGAVDGVLSVDPVFLQRVLAVAGPVTVGEGNSSVTLNGTNTVEMLLNAVYFNLSGNTAQDDFFRVAARAAFDRILHSSYADPIGMVRQLMGSAEGGHFYAWSAHDDEQRLLDGTSVGGTLVTEESGHYLGSGAPQQVIGIYYNDSMASKMDWYLERSVEDKLVATYENGREQHEVTIRLRNTLEASQVAGLPDNIVGFLENGAVKGNVQFITYLYVPAGGSVPEYKAGPNGDKGDDYAIHDGLTVIAKQVSLAPGESYEIKATVYTAVGSAEGQTVVRQTPLLQ